MINKYCSDCQYYIGFCMFDYDLSFSFNGMYCDNFLLAFRIYQDMD